MINSPYLGLPEVSFWKKGVESSNPCAMHGIYQKKWPIQSEWRIATAGSCFAQHIAKFMRKEGYNVLDVEPAPMGLPPSQRASFGYEIYSARYGNIYTVRQLLQIVREVTQDFTPQDWIWEKEGRFFDAFRPAVEPVGLPSKQDVIDHRAFHLSRVRRLLLEMDLFIFTMGLTELWLGDNGSTVYPTAPGTIAGSYDPSRYRFANMRYGELTADFAEFRQRVIALRGGRPFHVLLTVSPVPLTATASSQHVLTATIYSKSVLRAVAGDLAATNREIDYFPSYEIVTNPASRSGFYAENLRSVREEGVEGVMKVFLEEHSRAPIVGPASPKSSGKSEAPATSSAAQVQCEEALLEAFSE